MHLVQLVRRLSPKVKDYFDTFIHEKKKHLFYTVSFINDCDVHTAYVMTRVRYYT